MYPYQEKWINVHKRIEQKIEYENKLVGNRLTWLGTFEGLLMAAISFSLDKSALIVILFCCVGLLISISIGLSTRRARIGIHYYRSWWDKRKPDDIDLYDVEGYRYGTGRDWFLMPGEFIPWCFTAAFSIILLIVSISYYRGTPFIPQNFLETYIIMLP